jgi:hypothetical protein
VGTRVFDDNEPVNVDSQVGGCLKTKVAEADKCAPVAVLTGSR